jgi:hypothetical protein
VSSTARKQLVYVSTTARGRREIDERDREDGGAWGAQELRVRSQRRFFLIARMLGNALDHASQIAKLPHREQPI